MRPGKNGPPEGIVYRRKPRTVYCVDCAQRLGLWPEVRPSRRWMDAHPGKASGSGRDSGGLSRG